MSLFGFTKEIEVLNNLPPGIKPEELVPYVNGIIKKLNGQAGDLTVVTLDDRMLKIVEIGEIEVPGIGLGSGSDISSTYAEVPHSLGVYPSILTFRGYNDPNSGQLIYFPFSQYESLVGLANPTGSVIQTFSYFINPVIFIDKVRFVHGISTMRSDGGTNGYNVVPVSGFTVRYFIFRNSAN